MICECHNYDVINQISKQSTCYCGVFIPLSTGGKITKIDQELQKLSSKIKWHLFPDTVYKMLHNYYYTRRASDPIRLCYIETDGNGMGEPRHSITRYTVHRRDTCDKSTLLLLRTSITLFLGSDGLS